MHIVMSDGRARRTLLAAGPIYKLIVIYKQRPNNGAVWPWITAARWKSRRAAAGEHVKSSRKLKSFRENYEGHRKPRRSNVKTFAYHLQQITKGMLKFGQFQFTPCRLTRPCALDLFCQY